MNLQSPTYATKFTPSSRRSSLDVVASFGHTAATASAGGRVSLNRSVARRRGEVENSLAHVPSRKNKRPVRATSDI
jgi:hypothetical protein